MFPILAFSFFVAVELCTAKPSETILGRQNSICLDTKAVGQDPTCWAAYGYNSWLDTWKGPCPGRPGCACDVRKPWSDCVLSQYQVALGGPAKSNLSCVDLARPELCYSSPGDLAKVPKDQLAVVYVSVAVASKQRLERFIQERSQSCKNADMVLQDFYRFIRGWYITITQNPAPDPVLETLFDQISSPSNTDANRTEIHLAKYLASLMTNYSVDDAFAQNFRNTMTQVVGEDTVVDVGAMNIQAFQKILSQALSKTLNATLSAWNTPYFDTLAKNGALLNLAQIERPPQSSTSSFTEAALNQTFDITGNSRDLTPLNSTSRTLLSDDVLQVRNYTILECDAGEAGGLAEQISTLLDTIHDNLFKVMHETAKGKRSKLGFSLIWNSDRWRPIRAMYEKMYDNERISPSGIAYYQVLYDNRPVFICLQPHKKATSSLYSVCKEELRLRAFQDPVNPNLIGLCPSFWALPSAPARAFCPYKRKVTAGFIGTALQLNQQSVLIHHLAKTYLGGRVLEPEQVTLFDSMALDGQDAMRNPSTWAYWYSSVIGCTPQAWNDEL